MDKSVPTDPLVEALDDLEEIGTKQVIGCVLGLQIVDSTVVDLPLVQ